MMIGLWVGLALAGLAALGLAAWRWDRALREVGRGLEAPGSGTADAADPDPRLGPGGPLDPGLQRGHARDSGPDRSAGRRPPATARRAGGHGRGRHRGRPAPAVDLRQHERRRPLRPRLVLGRSARAGTDPQSPGAERRRGDPPAPPPGRLSGRAGLPAARVRHSAASRASSRFEELPCRDLLRPGPCSSFTM